MLCTPQLPPVIAPSGLPEVSGALRGRGQFLGARMLCQAKSLALMV